MKALLILFSLYFLSHNVFCINRNDIYMSAEYFKYKQVKYVCYVMCDQNYYNHLLVRTFIKDSMRVSTKDTNSDASDFTKMLQHWNVPVGVIVDRSCPNVDNLFIHASKSKLFDSMHYWLVINDNNTTYTEDAFQHLNLSVDADIVVAHSDEKGNYTFTDVFNFGKIQGNHLETTTLGSWSTDNGLSILYGGYKYYNRWNFHNLTLRAVSVILDQPEEFSPEQLSGEGYTTGVAAMTKITSQLLNTLKEKHNFRFNYTIAGRWIGAPQRNSTLAVTNSLYWGEQDISSTCARIFPAWLRWVDIFLPPTTNLETKFYYLIPDKGVGDYENRFLTPMSLGVWWCTFGACGVCSVVLAAGAWLEARPKPVVYAFFSVSAAICQQDFNDGTQEEKFTSQGRKLTLLVVGLTSMLLYNYYTSSVVSWLLSAATPSIDSLDKLLSSDLELIFEDIGYTRGWMDNPGFYYYSGYKNVKEDELRVKVLVKRSTKTLQTAAGGIQLIRSGGFAFHTEPYTASQVISKTFLEEELCELGSLQMMPPANVYIMSQKQSPYKEFFVWSLMRLAERGHFQASRGRFPGTIPPCSGRRPRALALGQAAPVFLLLLQFTLLSLFILLLERLHYRAKLSVKPRVLTKTALDHIACRNHKHNRERTRRGTHRSELAPHTHNSTSRYNLDNIKKQ